MRKDEAITRQLGIYVIEEQNFRSKGGMLDKHVRVLCDPELRVDITEVVAKICGYKLSRNKRAFGTILNSNCYGFWLSDYVCESIKKHSHEIANAAQPLLFEASLKARKEEV